MSSSKPIEENLDEFVTAFLAAKKNELISAPPSPIPPPDQDYPMDSMPSGNCLIIDNIEFDNDPAARRYGSDLDSKRMQEIFTQYGFIVTYCLNLKAQEVTDIVKKVSKDCSSNHDALVVIIYSHGTESDKFYGTDGELVSFEDNVVTCFDNANCPALHGKPKLFMFLACRGELKDLGVEIASQDCYDIFPTRPPTDLITRIPRPSYVPTRTDMMIIYATRKGHVAVRNKQIGTWFGTALAHSLNDYGDKIDIVRILNLVASWLEEAPTEDGCYQSPELKLIGWKKNLTFKRKLT